MKTKLISISTALCLLQLFTYDPQAQPANNTGAAALAPENKEYYDKVLIRYAKPKLVHNQFGQERDIPKGSGQKVEFRSFASLGKQTTPLVEGVTPEAQSLTVTKIEATVHQYGGFVETTDMLNLASIDPVITETVMLLGDQAGTTLDTITRDILNTGTNVAYAAHFVSGTETATSYRHVLDTTAKLTVKEIKKQVTALRAQNAPTIDGYYICIVHPYVAEDLMNDEDWIKSQIYTEQNVKKVYDGEIGCIAGARIIQSTEAKIFAAADLASDSRTLSASADVEVASATISVTGGTITSDSLKDRYVIINGNRYKVTGNNASAITISSAITLSSGDVIYPGEAGAGGVAVFSCLFLGKNAYGKTKIDGGGLKTIVKQLGSSGTADPLDQRATVGWKAIHTAEILIPQYIRRLEVGGSYATADQEAN